MVSSDFVVWGYQHQFCVVASNRAERLFDALGPSFAAEVFLVGLGHDHPDAPAVILEAERPEALAPALAELPRTLARVVEEQQASRYKLLIHGPEGVAERYERGIPLGIARKAVLEHLQQGPLALERRFWAARAHAIRGYWVVPVLSLSAAAVARYPTLSRGLIRDVKVPTSLVEAVADEFLKACGRALRLPNAGEDLVEDLDFGDEEDIVRRAAANLMYVPVFAAGGALGGLGVLFSTCDALSAEPYERSETQATLLVCKPGHPSVEPLLPIAEPVELSSARAARKVLQMSAAGLSILSDGTSIWGLGRLSSSEPYDRTREDLFEIRFTGRLRWELRHADTVLFQVENRRVVFPRVPLEEQDFRTFLRRTFPGIAAQHVARLWECVSAVLSAHRGAILIVSPAAAQEAGRLKSQGTPITPTPLEAGVVVAATRIDGAVLLDPTGVCHAVGVILDGMVTPDGRRSRGSRFNSALQYVTYRRGTVAVVISDDGTVDLLPSLRPQVSRSDVEAALGELRALRAGALPFERLGRVMEALYALEFYLSADECSEVNRLRTEIEAAHPPEPFEARLLHRDLVPSPAMNASYFTDGPTQ